MSFLSLSIYQALPPSFPPSSCAPFPPAPLSILILRCKGTACHIQHAQKKDLPTLPPEPPWMVHVRAKEIGAHLAGRECQWPCLKSSRIPVFHPNRSRQDGGHQCWLDASLPRGVPLGSILGPPLICSILSNLVTGQPIRCMNYILQKYQTFCITPLAKLYTQVTPCFIFLLLFPHTMLQMSQLPPSETDTHSHISPPNTHPSLCTIMRTRDSLTPGTLIHDPALLRVPRIKHNLGAMWRTLQNNSSAEVLPAPGPRTHL